MESAGFVPEPNCGRGTLGIVWACLPTIMFVLYTAIHKDSQRSMPRFMWAFFIFFVPDSMPASAIDQLIKANRLKKRLRALQGWGSWTLKQSFLVVKRGVMEVGGGNTLTPSRLVELAMRQEDLGEKGGGIYIEILPSGQAIDRRSKKSWFEKLLAGCQALWFCANMVSRLVEGYPVTLLEDMTIAYTCCGLVASLAWLRCPQDIEDPFEVDLDVVDDVVFSDVECGYPLNQASSSSNSSSVSRNIDSIKPSCPVTGSDCVMMTTVCVVLSLLAAIHMAEWN